MEISNTHGLLILAGGNSIRMGYPKPWLKTKKNTTFLSEIISVYKQIGIINITVVLNEECATSEWKKEISEIKPNATIVINKEVDKGRLFSIQLGLKATNSDYIFIQNVDNPYIEKDVLNQLLISDEKNEITIPSYKEKGGHPVIINSIVKHEIIHNYSNYKTLKDVFNLFPKSYVLVNSSSVLLNINTREDFEVTIYEPV